MEDLSDEKLKNVLKISENNDSDSNSSREPSITSRQNSELTEITSTDELLGSTCVVLSVKQVVEALSSAEISDDQFTQAEQLEVSIHSCVADINHVHGNIFTHIILFYMPFAPFVRI